MVKRTLTSLQITQFLVGASYAMSHSFVSYTIPGTALPQVPQASEPAEAASSALLDGLKRAFFSALGSEDVVQQQQQQQQQTTTTTGGPEAGQPQTVPCIANNGATFAIWLNVVYLAPLTYLFVKFFITSYLKRSSAEQARAKKMQGASGSAEEKAAAGKLGLPPQPDRRLSNVALAERAGWDAAREVEREVYGEGKQEETEVAVETEDEGEVVAPALHNGALADRSRLAANGHAGGKTRANGRATRNRP